MWISENLPVDGQTIWTKFQGTVLATSKPKRHFSPPNDTMVSFDTIRRSPTVETVSSYTPHNLQKWPCYPSYYGRCRCLQLVFSNTSFFLILVPGNPQICDLICLGCRCVMRQNANSLMRRATVESIRAFFSKISPVNEWKQLSSVSESKSTQW